MKRCTPPSYFENFDCWIGKSPMPHVLIHGNPPEYRGETVCKFSATLTVRNLTFFQNLFRLSNLSDFHHFSIFSDHFLFFSIVYIPNSIQNRSELFAAKMWGRCGVERAVLTLCATGPNRSLPGGAVRAFFTFIQLASNFA